MGSRRKARELVTQVLFFMEYSPGDAEKSFELICENFEAPESLRSFSKELVKGVSGKLVHIDRLIKEASKNWRLERMSRVDRSILRLSIYEMLYMDSIPCKVSIDEAVELGKRYGTEESGAFINGVLDYIYMKYMQDKNRE
ncbi:MAG: transcription antitermination factor NusB [Deltaproteobacteria bacterium]|nr:transcription antitermination factor NusB [Deltaproteobacteria bacterium]